MAALIPALIKLFMSSRGGRGGGGGSSSGSAYSKFNSADQKRLAALGKIDYGDGKLDLGGSRVRDRITSSRQRRKNLTGN